GWGSMGGGGSEETGGTPAGATVRKGDMLYRTLGRTGEQVSLIGLGGFHLGQPGEEEAIRIVRTAVDRGVTFMDNCWDYNGGASEIPLGKELRVGSQHKCLTTSRIHGQTERYQIG